MKKILFALMVACALAMSAVAQDKQHDHKQMEKQAATKAADAKDQFLGKGDGVETCPVTGEPIENKDVKGDFFGWTVYFCCAGCLDEAKKMPAAYIKKTHAEQLVAIKNVKAAKDAGHDHHGGHEMAQDKAAEKAKDSETKFLGKGDGIETCPVTGEPVNKNLKSEVNGQTFYVCCEGCIETVKKNPDAYLKKQDKK